MDVQQTRDEVLVIMHDARVDRTTNGTGKVRDLTLSQIKALDAGSWYSPLYRGERVPTLTEVLDLFRSLSTEARNKTKLIIELKAGNEVYPGIEERTIALVKTYGLEGSVLYKSFHPAILKRIRKIAPRVPQIYVFLASFPALNFSMDPLPHWIGVFQVPVEFLQPKAQFLTRGFVKAAHLRGYGIIAWDVQSAKLVSKMKTFGVDGIETDDPALVHP